MLGVCQGAGLNKRMVMTGVSLEKKNCKHDVEGWPEAELDSVNYRLRGSGEEAEGGPCL
jgi:hypothetical protein